LRVLPDALGVSRTTVSNAYSRPDQLNPRLRQRILQTARQLGYAGPHPAARSLRSGRADAVGVLLTETLSYAFTDPAAVRFLEGMAQAGERAGVSLLLVPALPTAAGATAVREAVVDGFVVYSMPDAHPGVLAVVERRQPTVIVDEPRLQGTPLVGIDDRAAARQAAEHLLALGHERFGVVCFRLSLDGYSGPVDAARLAGATFQVTHDRLAGYADALRAAGLDFRDVPIQERAPNSPEAGAAAAAALLDRRHPPTAILSTSDQLAIGLLEQARRRGIAVPRDLSVVGFDDIDAAAAVTPSLTTGSHCSTRAALPGGSSSARKRRRRARRCCCPPNWWSAPPRRLCGRAAAAAPARPARATPHPQDQEPHRRGASHDRLHRLADRSGPDTQGRLVRTAQRAGPPGADPPGPSPPGAAAPAAAGGLRLLADRLEPSTS
jgi:DNA-binding LacI/PurR family transcriptional regulator